MNENVHLGLARGAKKDDHEVFRDYFRGLEVRPGDGRRRPDHGLAVFSLNEFKRTFGTTSFCAFGWFFIFRLDNTTNTV